MSTSETQEEIIKINSNTIVYFERTIASYWYSTTVTYVPSYDCDDDDDIYPRAQVQQKTSILVNRAPGDICYKAVYT